MVVKKRSSYAIDVNNLSKSFGDLNVLKSINFKVKKGSVMALLGPNGAGKTTTIKILSTLLLPDAGSATVNGNDVVKNDAEARASIGLTGQFSAVDSYLTGEENLYLIGRLYHMSKKDAQSRTDDLLKQFDLLDKAKKPVKTYSGGLKRRLDLAMSLIAKPPIIFLDEPTTGLDPPSRLNMWALIEKLVSDGITVLLTTQYMDEADRLADNIVVLDNGKIIAEGTSEKLKRTVGSDRLEFTLVNSSDFEAAKKIVDGKNIQSDPGGKTISITAEAGTKDLRNMLNKFDEARIKLESAELRRPTLDDVFLILTGHAVSSIDQEESDKSKPKKGSKK